MGISKKITCDGCGKELKCGYLFLEKGFATPNNGKRRGHTIGYQEVKFEDVAACSIDCLTDIITYKNHKQHHDPDTDYFMIGEAGDNISDPNTLDL